MPMEARTTLHFQSSFSHLTAPALYTRGQRLCQPKLMPRRTRGLLFLSTSWVPETFKAPCCFTGCAFVNEMQVINVKTVSNNFTVMALAKCSPITPYPFCVYCCLMRKNLPP